MTQKRRTYPHHVSLYLNDEQRALLSKIVAQTNIDASKHLRRALTMYVEAKGHLWLRHQPKTHPGHERAGRTGEQLPVLILWSD